MYKNNIENPVKIAEKIIGRYKRVVGFHGTCYVTRSEMNIIIEGFNYLKKQQEQQVNNSVSAKIKINI